MTGHGMSRLGVLLLLLAAVVAVLFVPLASAGLDGPASDSCANTPKCKCKWSSGKSVADCSNAGLGAIPSTLKPGESPRETRTGPNADLSRSRLFVPEIQIVILDGNPIVNIHKDAFKNAGLVNLHKISMKNCSLK